MSGQARTQTALKRLERVVCAPDSFKGTLCAQAAAEAMAEGVARIDETIICDQCPVADGGEGSLDALIKATKGTIHRAIVTGPLGTSLEACYGIAGDGKTGLVELAQASGLTLIPSDDRDPTRTTTYGTGELIAAAVDRGCETIIVCIGGSGTIDGGIGIAQALGAKFFDSKGQLLDSALPGGRLSEIASFQLPESLPQINVACDVTNRLLAQSDPVPRHVRNLNRVDGSLT